MRRRRLRRLRRSRPPLPAPFDSMKTGACGHAKGRTSSPKGGPRAKECTQYASMVENHRLPKPPTERVWGDFCSSVCYTRPQDGNLSGLLSVVNLHPQPGTPPAMHSHVPSTGLTVQQPAGPSAEAAPSHCCWGAEERGAHKHKHRYRHEHKYEHKESKLCDANLCHHDPLGKAVCIPPRVSTHVGEYLGRQVIRPDRQHVPSCRLPSTDPT